MGHHDIDLRLRTGIHSGREDKAEMNITKSLYRINW